MRQIYNYYRGYDMHYDVDVRLEVSHLMNNITPLGKPTNFDKDGKLVQFNKNTEITSEGVINETDDGSVTLTFPVPDYGTWTISFAKDNAGFVTLEIGECPILTTFLLECGKPYSSTLSFAKLPLDIITKGDKIENSLLEDGILNLDFTMEILGGLVDKMSLHLVATKASR